MIKRDKDGKLVETKVSFHELILGHKPEPPIIKSDDPMADFYAELLGKAICK
ncbi:MAG: hypothetical protein HY764_00110 [Candidatus Portnoybacteria bacterium]|nr:hypothetical protein [Candidatus Portnoybacteria bacterium]